MFAAWRRFVADEQGADLIEYALLAAIVALGAVEALSVFVLGLNSLFEPVTAALTSFLP